jgi:hypothetical protein
MWVILLIEKLYRIWCVAVEAVRTALLKEVPDLPFAVESIDVSTNKRKMLLDMGSLWSVARGCIQTPCQRRAWWKSKIGALRPVVSVVYVLHYRDASGEEKRLLCHDPLRGLHGLKRTPMRTRIYSCYADDVDCTELMSGILSSFHPEEAELDVESVYAYLNSHKEIGYRPLTIMDNKCQEYSIYGFFRATR